MMIGQHFRALFSYADRSFGALYETELYKTLCRLESCKVSAATAVSEQLLNGHRA